jgi:hypothetical protein
MVLRLTIGIIHVTRPEILILDEALNAGDAQFRQQASQQMDSLTNQARILLFTSHQMQDIATYCNKCMVLHEGKITYFGNVNDAITAYYRHAYNIIEWPDTRITSLSVSLFPNQPEITIDEAIEVCISFTLNAPVEVLYPVLTIYGPHGPLLSDSPFYYPQPQAFSFGIGQHRYKVALPKHTFNTGEFSVAATLVDEARILVQVNAAATFRITPGNWEQSKPWESKDLTFPLRPKLDWIIDSEPN